ncbi:hypothetical protein TPB0596_32160 [Tsukamurella pulmonis]|uniref:helix-turn-helix domain-containing protein n=1 Tax=Tsukamurella pulmonis TaxID=47312 RepID=UPI00308E49B4|nr:hypothetical protein TPB0596_32160 [Tsukamurella pulmonis]
MQDRDLIELEAKLTALGFGRRGTYRPNPYEIRRAPDHTPAQLEVEWTKARDHATSTPEWVARRASKPRRCICCRKRRPTFDFPTDCGYRGPRWALGGPHRPVCYPCRLGGTTELTRRCWRCDRSFLVPHGGSERRWCSLGCQSAGQRAAARGVAIPSWDVVPGYEDRTVQPESVQWCRLELNAERTVGKNGKIYPARAAGPERDAQIRALRAEGVSVRKIAAEVGCSVGTVHRIVKAA